MASDNTGTTKCAGDCGHHCDTDESEQYGEQDYDSLGNDPGVPGFSDKRVV